MYFNQTLQIPTGKNKVVLVYILSKNLEISYFRYSFRQSAQYTTQKNLQHSSILIQVYYLYHRLMITENIHVKFLLNK